MTIEELISDAKDFMARSVSAEVVNLEGLSLESFKWKLLLNSSKLSLDLKR